MKIVFCVVYVSMLIAYTELQKKEAYEQGYSKALKECNSLPLRPIVAAKAYGDIDWQCPRCGHRYLAIEKEKQNYCGYCGCKIDWED